MNDLTGDSPHSWSLPWHDLQRRLAFEPYPGALAGSWLARVRSGTRSRVRQSTSRPEAMLKPWNLAGVRL